MVTDHNSALDLAGSYGRAECFLETGRVRLGPPSRRFGALWAPGSAGRPSVVEAIGPWLPEGAAPMCSPISSPRASATIAGRIQPARLRRTGGVARIVFSIPL